MHRKTNTHTHTYRQNNKEQTGLHACRPPQSSFYSAFIYIGYNNKYIVALVGRALSPKLFIPSNKLFLFEHY